MLRKKNTNFERSKTTHQLETKRLIGNGGFCDVYQISESKATKELVHLRKENIERFKREIEFIKSVNHPNIIKIIDERIDDENKRYSYTMDLYSHNYEQYIERNKKSLNDFPLEILENIFDAVIYLHEQDIIHRDLKPSNILVNLAPLEVVIADFGLGKSMMKGPSLTQIGLGMGTENYSVPELLEGRQNVDARSDIYSLGKILEFTVNKLEIVCQQEIKQIVSTATEYKVEKRYSSVTELKNIFLDSVMIYSHRATIDKVIKYLTEQRDVRLELFDDLFNNIIRMTIQKAEDREFEIEFKKILSCPQIVNYYLTVAQDEFMDYLGYYCELVQDLELSSFDDEADFIVSCLYQLIENPGAEEALLVTVWTTLVQLAFVLYKHEGSYKILKVISTEFNKTLESGTASFEEQLLHNISQDADLSTFYHNELKNTHEE